MPSGCSLPFGHVRRKQPAPAAAPPAAPPADGAAEAWLRDGTDREGAGRSRRGVVDIGAVRVELESKRARELSRLSLTDAQRSSQELPRTVQQPPKIPQGSLKHTKES